MKATGILILIILILSAQAWAQSSEEAVDLTYGTAGFGLRAAGMGNAFEGVADDYSAIFWNPAGLAQMHQGEVYTSLYNLNFKNESTYLNHTTSGQNDFTRFGSLGMVYPFPVKRGSLVLAFGYQKVKNLGGFTQFAGHLNQSNDLSFDFDLTADGLGVYKGLYFDKDIDQEETINSSGSLASWSMAAAIDLSPKFSGGVTLSYLSGKNEYMQEYLQTNPNNNFNILDNGNKFYYDSYRLTQNLNSDYSAFQAKVGGLFRLNDQLRLGGSITLPMTIDVKESWDVSDELLYDVYVASEDALYAYPPDKASIDNGNFKYHIKVPFKFSGGVSFRSDLFLISASGKYCDWTQTRFEEPDGYNRADYANLLDENRYFNQDFRPVFSYALGGELYLLKGLAALRAGYRYLPSPLKNVSSDLDRIYYSAGIGVHVDQGTLVEASYAIGSWKATRYYDYNWDTSAEMQTNEKYTTSKLQVGLRLSF